MKKALIPALLAAASVMSVAPVQAAEKTTVVKSVAQAVHQGAQESRQQQQQQQQQALIGEDGGVLLQSVSSGGFDA